MTYREAVYMVMDLLHLMSDDAGYTEQHIIFLLNKYRIFLLKNADKDAASAANISDSAYQTIELTLQRQYTSAGISCAESDIITDIYYLWKSNEKLPVTANIGNPKVYYLPNNADNGAFFQVEMPYISMDRMKYVGQNKWLKSFFYTSVGPDNYLYAKSVKDYGNPVKVVFKAIFENPEDAIDPNTDILDADLPIDEALIPQLIDYIVKLIAAAEYRPDDPFNNAADDLARMAQYLRSRMKTDFQRQLEI